MRCPLSLGPALPARGAGEEPAGRTAQPLPRHRGESLSSGDFPALDPWPVPLQVPTGLLTALGVPPVLSSKLKLLLALSLSQGQDPVWGASKPFLFKPSPRQKGQVHFQSPPRQYCCPEHQGWPDAVPPDSRRVREVPQKRPVLVYSSRGSQTPSSQQPASPPGPRGALTPTQGGGKAPRCALVQAPGLGMYVARRGGSDTGWYRAGPRFAGQVQHSAMSREWALPAAPPRAPLRSGARHGLTCCSSRVLWHCPQVLLHLAAPRASPPPERQLAAGCRLTPGQGLW